MSLFVLGINHKTAPVAIREKVAFGPEQLQEALPMASARPGVEELAVVSTCNRTELYCSLSNVGIDCLLEWVSDYHNVSLSDLKRCVYVHEDEEAASHMMRVASGLDSLVLGEPQILGQLKDAHSVARNLGTLGGPLDRLFQHTFSVAKRVRTETAIGENPVSVAFAAVSMASHIFADMSSNTALLIGAGETIELVARHLYQAGVRSMIVANRTLSRARDLAEMFHGSAIGLSDIPAYLEQADIIIASTASPLPILGKGAVERALKKRKHRPMFMVDIAVPRDIEQEVDELADVYLYTVDDLRQVIDDNMKSREGAAEEAEHLIAAGAADFMYHLRALDSVSVLKTFRDQAEGLRDTELTKAMKRLEKGDDPEAVLRLLAHGLTNKLIHHPTVQVRRASAEGRLEVTGWLRDLFQLPDDKLKQD
ncbi:glutamyl-tRNA reductase [Hahella ganghwensis]|uniref:glutamyl-tRNA reductase n=1 Tax=Hahella ganghwensis TaxID=286420 RepID=UPI00036321A5|nr:glutamyl-tRNA reductase [Hahella ganghwensis]